MIFEERQKPCRSASKIDQGSFGPVFAIAAKRINRQGASDRGDVQETSELEDFEDATPRHTKTSRNARLQAETWIPLTKCQERSAVVVRDSISAVFIFSQ
jgi:hypothetical protein